MSPDKAAVISILSVVIGWAIMFLSAAAIVIMYRKLNFKKLSFLSIICILGLIIMTNGMKLTVAMYEKQEIIRQEKEIAAVQEFETNLKISADKAWWINMEEERLKSNCQALAEKLGQDWQILYNQLSDGNLIVIIEPKLK